MFTSMRQHLRRILLGASVVFTFGLLCLWSWTTVVNNIRLLVCQSLNRSVNIRQGEVVWERTCRFKHEIPTAQFIAAPLPPQRVIPKPVPMLGFAFSSDARLTKVVNVQFPEFPLPPV